MWQSVLSKEDIFLKDVRWNSFGVLELSVRTPNWEVPSRGGKSVLLPKTILHFLPPWKIEDSIGVKTERELMCLSLVKGSSAVHFVLTSKWGVSKRISHKNWWFGKERLTSQFVFGYLLITLLICSPWSDHWSVERGLTRKGMSLWQPDLARICEFPVSQIHCGN